MKPRQGEQPAGDAFVTFHQPAPNSLSGPVPDSAERSSPEENPPGEPEPEEIARQAYDEGFSRGEQEGIEAGRQQTAKVLERLDELLKGIESLWPDMIQTQSMTASGIPVFTSL